MSEQNEQPYEAATVRAGIKPRDWLKARSVKIAVVMTGITWVYMKSTSPDVVVFDMKGTIDLFMQQSAQLQLDEGKAKVLTARFNTAMSDSLAAWQTSHNAIILVKPAVVSPLPDITPDIRRDIARRTQEGQ